MVSSTGTVINETAALIEGGIDVDGDEPAHLENFGTISGARPYGEGIDTAMLLSDGYGEVSIVNGSSADHAALITGGITVVGTMDVTLTNFGKVTASGTAIALGGADGLIIEEPGAVLDGVVNGGTGHSTFTLAAGTGTFSNLARVGSFSEIEVAAKGKWQLTGNAEVVAGTTLAVLGTLDSAVVLNVDGRVDNAGLVALGGGLTLGGSGAGVFDNRLGATLDLTGSQMITSLGGVGSRLVNDGLVERTGTGTTTLSAAVANRGTIAAADGTLALAGRVTGTGTVEIEGGAVLQAGGPIADTQRVAFVGAKADLVFLDPATFAAKLAGFARTDELDFRTIADGIATKALYASGTLTVTDGPQIASVALLGQFSAAGFATAADGHGGTDVTYTPPAAARPESLGPPVG